MFISIIYSLIISYFNILYLVNFIRAKKIEERIVTLT